MVPNERRLSLTDGETRVASGRSESAKDAPSGLLEHYLTSYNPLQIDLTQTKEETRPRSLACAEEAPSDTDTRPMSNCYAFNCSNKRKLHHGRQYTRLKERETGSTHAAAADDDISQCSTKLTSVTLPVVMVTDCSDSQRLHTDIIELDED